MPRLPLTNLAASLSLSSVHIVLFSDYIAIPVFQLVFVPQTYGTFPLFFPLLFFQWVSLFSWVEVAKSAHMFCHINLVTKKQNNDSWRRDMTLTTMSMLRSSHVWNIMKAAQWKFSLSFSNCDSLEIPRGMYWHSAHSETEALVWSHIIKVCRVLKTSTINDLKWLSSTKSNDIIRAHRLTSLTDVRPPLQCD